MKKLIILGLIMISFISVNAKKTNPYHTPGTKEYKQVTAKLLGLWTISSFTQKDKNKMEECESATFEFVDKGIKTGECVFRFKLNKDMVDKRLHAWNKKGVTLNVDEYYIICTADFRIHKKGDLVYIENPKYTVEITGSGEQLENFQGVEAAYIETQSAMKESGGLTNLVGAKLLKEVSGTTFVPRIPEQVNYKNLKDNSVEFVTLFKHSLKMVK
ncbi:MAG: hypothetical protein JW857_01170 [Bacteroidales bacterium]|nr:hypothetical protein [Bacteroidales bacterium]